MFFRKKTPQDDLAELTGQIDQLREQNRKERSTEREIEIRRLTGLAGLQMRAHPASDPQFVAPGGDVPRFGEQSGVPEVDRDGLTAEVLRAAILDSGCLLVRGLVDDARAKDFATGIDKTMEARPGVQAGEPDPDGYYDEFKATVGTTLPHSRPWAEECGGILAIDSPRLMFEMTEIFREAGINTLVDEYLGEPAAISAQKCALRKVVPETTGAWHQDGSFLGDVRALNLWISLSRCGDEAPGMDLVPRRLDDYVKTGGEGTYLGIQISQQTAEEAAGDRGVVRPIFEPGDALLFDEVFLHSTAADPAMPNPRYAIESWFFGPSAFPEKYFPLSP